MAPPFDATLPSTPAPADSSLVKTIDDATRRIAPAWPLDRLAAVNPFWGRVDQPVETAFAEVGALSGSRLLMPREWYTEQWSAGHFHLRHIEAALAGRQSDFDVHELVHALDGTAPATARRSLSTDVADLERDLSHQMSWAEYVVGRISHFCASYFDGGQADTESARERGLYREWLANARRDRGPEMLMKLSSFRSLVGELPDSPFETLALALEELAIPVGDRSSYLTALLMDVGGWASWCAYLRWTAGLEGREDSHIDELLAIRIGWELVLHRAGEGQRRAWQRAIADWPAARLDAAKALEIDWILQDAIERAYQERLTDGLRAGTTRSRPARPEVQAAFCIDVRSEVFRRSLESVSGQKTRTLGFAGFFGLPVEYRAVGANATIPQLPGLLGPSYQVTDEGTDTALALRRGERLGFSEAWRGFKKGAISTFSFVEATGLFYGVKLLGHTLGWSRPEPIADRAGLSDREHAKRKPRLTSVAGDGGPIPLEARIDLAEGILRAMSLSQRMAPLVALVGHGSSTSNNPVAAGLDCGACCGQSGAVNARAVAALLNDADVRAGLCERGLRVPADTHFVPGLHDTTTDEVTLFDRDDVPSSHGSRVEQLERWLRAAGDGTRRERAPSLGLGDLPGDHALRRAIERRATDWSEVRPEWGLAGNASFIVAPRERCDHLDLEGRSFLHEYRWEEDEGFGVLEGLMTAPMVVTHWINFQYYASTVDNHRFGSGNKTLHNVVGGHIGVFEGNGGDLRVGLPLQCLHDGDEWVHTPLRLSVFIEAPRDAIAGVLAAHETVRHLVDHGWLHLFQIDAGESAVRRYERGEWVCTGGRVEP